MSGAETSLGDVAIVGMAGRFPKSPDVASFWRNLRGGVECIRFFSEEELLEAGVDPALARDPSYVPAHGWLDGIDLFDAPFFEVSPREAEVTDPQFRLFLEVAWEALEDAGIDPARAGGAIGVIAGVSSNAYVIDNLLPNPDVIEALGYVQTALANHTDFLATRVAYKLDLRGPAVTVQTACSTSLVAVHMACQSLLSGESDAVLAGGVCVTALKKRGYLHVEGGTNTSDGHVRTFDARGDGMLGGNGVGVVVLKRLRDALAEGDAIRAVVKGSAINNDGAHKVSFTAPSVDGQAKVVLDALDVSGVDPATITMVEAHGTATPLGDPIEVRALTQAWRHHTDVVGTCAIGSAKTNLGHLDIAAGVTGLIKAALSLEHREIPPSLHFERPNPEIDFASSPFFVNTELRPWRTGGQPRRAAVSSFGMGGTNAHAILEEAPAPVPGDPGRRFELLPLAARTEGALAAMPGRLARALEDRELDLADVAHTLQVGRAAFPVRRAVVARDRAEAIAALDALDARRATAVARAEPRRPVAFLFSGQGAQYAGMARGLLDEPAFRTTLERVAVLLEPHVGRDLLALLHPDPSAHEEAGRLLARTELTQPALFALELALAELWRSFGIEPQAMLGHSIGEYVAATLAGVLSLEDACRLVAARGRLIGSLPAGGAMLAVHAGEAEVAPALSERLSLAAVNAPGLVVVSGPETELAGLETRLESRGVGTRRLHTSHAFHSSLMDPILDAFRAEVEAVTLRAPELPIVSCTTGRWLSDAEARDPGYWVAHLRRPVRFADGVATLLGDAGRVLLEVGPGETLASLARLCAPPRAVVVSSTRHPKDERDDLEVLTRALGELWCAGVEPEWKAYQGGRRRRRVPLPAYPFEHKRYWIEPGAGAPAGTAAPRAHEPARAADLADWFFVPGWRQAPPALAPAHAGDPERPWLVFTDGGGLAESLRAELAARGLAALEVRPGQGFAADADGFCARPGSEEDLRRLWAALDERGLRLGALLYLWSAAPGETREEGEARAFWTPFHLARALAERPRDRALPFVAVTAGLATVLSARGSEPLAALVAGPLKSLRAEAEGVLAKAVDLAPESLGARETAALLADEVQAEARDPEVALAGGRRWVLEQGCARLPAPGGARRPALALREAGTYLVTGGLGGIGLCFAEHLAREARANLVLLATAELPPREAWDGWLAGHSEDERTAVRIRGVRALEALGASVLTAAAPADDRAAMERVLAAARERFGEIHGVIHAAGVVGSGLLVTKTPAEAARVLSPKVAGARLLTQLFPDGSLDFLLLVSSIASAAGVLSGVDYAAANAYLDALARSRAGGATRVCAWGWDAWRDVGLAARSALPAAQAARYEEDMRFAIAPDDGRAAFARLLAAGLPHAYVSPIDLVRRDDLAAARAAREAQERAAEPTAADAPERPGAESAPRPELSTPFEAPEGETERQIAAVWSELLGVAPIGAQDSFFELGGNSLVMMQLNVRLRALFGVSLPIRELFESPRVGELAERIDSIRAVSAAPLSVGEGGPEEEVEEFTL